VLGSVLLAALALWLFLALYGTPLDAVQGVPYRCSSSTCPSSSART